MTINKPDAMSNEEVRGYVEYLQEKYNRKLDSLNIAMDRNDPDYVGLTYKFADVPFERIRRITGYLVGTMDQWNDAKTAEEADRVKHDMAAPAMETI